MLFKSFNSFLSPLSVFAYPSASFLAFIASATSAFVSLLNSSLFFPVVPSSLLTACNAFFLCSNAFTSSCSSFTCCLLVVDFETFVLTWLICLTSLSMSPPTSIGISTFPIELRSFCKFFIFSVKASMERTDSVIPFISIEKTFLFCAIFQFVYLKHILNVIF